MVSVNVCHSIGSMIKFVNYAAKIFQAVQPALKMDQNVLHVKTNFDNLAKMVFHVNASHSTTKIFKTKLVNHVTQNILVCNVSLIMITNVRFVTKMVTGIQLLLGESVNAWMGTMNMMENVCFVWFLAVQFVRRKILVNNVHKKKNSKRCQYKINANANLVRGYQIMVHNVLTAI